MNFAWPDPISFVADVIAIVGIPTLYVLTKTLYRETKKARESQSVSHRALSLSFQSGTILTGFREPDSDLARRNPT